MVFSCKKKVTSNSTVKNTASSSSNVIGVRNNNPLNIRVSSNAWLGKVTSDNGFEKFSEMKFGIRAAVKNLQTYYTKYKLKSVSKIINKWAPDSDGNNTKVYSNYVAKAMNVSTTEDLSYTSETFAKLVAAMSEIEIGKANAVSENQVLEVIKEFSLF